MLPAESLKSGPGDTPNYTDGMDDSETEHAHEASGPHEGVRSPRPRPLAWTVGVVGILAGIMFATNANLFATAPDERRPQNLAELVRDEQERLASAQGTVEELRAQVSELVAEQVPHPVISPDLEVAAGRVEVDGPGVIVKLWDAPLREPLPTGIRPDDLLVHQQDLEGVINSLWAGGAEAMSVQGHRVTGWSSIRCVGNVLLIDGSVYSPPYEIAAIGDPMKLSASLMGSPVIQTYLEYVEALQLGWSMEAREEIKIAADTGTLTADFAESPPAAFDRPAGADASESEAQ